MKSSVTISSMWSMLQKHSVLIIMLIVMFGTTFCNFSEFIDYELKSKWYCLYLMISIFIPLFLLASYKNKMAQQICVSKYLLTILVLYFFISIEALCPPNPSELDITAFTSQLIPLSLT